MFGMFCTIQLIHLTPIIHMFSRNHTNVMIFPKLRNNDVTYIHERDLLSFRKIDLIMRAILQRINQTLSVPLCHYQKQSDEREDEKIDG